MSQWQPSNPHTGQQLWTHLWSPPRLGIPAARVGLCGAEGLAPIPPHLPRNPLILRHQPQTTRQSLCRPTVPRSVTELDWGKQRNLCRIDPATVDTTLPIGSNTMDTFHSLTDSPSKVVEPLAPSVTSTLLGKAGPQEGRTISSDSRHSSASLFASSSFNLPRLPSIGFGSLTPSVPSIAGSHHILSTWPLNSFPSRPPTPWLTIDQANSIFGLVSECQALGVKLAKDFQTLSG